MNKFEQILCNCPILPVVTIDNEVNATNVASSLSNGGINIIEVTFRSGAAAKSIKLIKTLIPNMVVGAGTIKTKSQLKDAVENGADFIVSPHLDANLIKYAKELDVFCIPGIQTATEIEMAEELGVNIVKFFPAEYAGGTNMIKSWESVFPNIKFIPTGGITIKTMNDYLMLKNVLCVGGSWIAKERLINDGSFTEISNNAKDALKRTLDLRLSQV